MSDQTGTAGPLRNYGVYRIDFDGRAPEFLVALENTEGAGDYAYALARAVPIPGAGFTYDESEFLIFVEIVAEEESEDEPQAKLYTVFHDGQGCYDGRPASDLSDTGLLASPPRLPNVTAPAPGPRVCGGTADASADAEQDDAP